YAFRPQRCHRSDGAARSVLVRPMAGVLWEQSSQFSFLHSSTFLPPIVSHLRTLYLEAFSSTCPCSRSGAPTADLGTVMEFSPLVRPDFHRGRSNLLPLHARAGADD